MTSSTLVSPTLPRSILLLWLGLALALGASGVLTAFPPPGPQLLLLGLTALTIWAGTRAGPIRDWIDRLPLQAFPALHLIRFVGISFLILAARGELSATFANAAGDWGHRGGCRRGAGSAARSPDHTRQAGDLADLEYGRHAGLGWSPWLDHAGHSAGPPGGTRSSAPAAVQPASDLRSTDSDREPGVPVPSAPRSEAPCLTPRPFSAAAPACGGRPAP